MMKARTTRDAVAGLGEYLIAKVVYTGGAYLPKEVFPAK